MEQSLFDHECFEQGWVDRVLKRYLDESEAISTYWPRAGAFSNPGSTLIYILKRRMAPRQRGRKHMAVFDVNPSLSHVDPTNPTERCLDTMIHITGSPLAGFGLEMRRNFNRQKTENIESVHLLCRMDVKNIMSQNPNLSIVFSTIQAKRRSGPDCPDCVAVWCFGPAVGCCKSHYSTGQTLNHPELTWLPVPGTHL
jgi:hypothetical protein